MNNNIPEVSIVVPVYNAEKYIERCVNSLLAQKLDNIEIICVDDCSTDNSFNILKTLQLKAPEKIIIKRLDSNRRQGGARNAGIDLSNGEYIAFVDSDDWVDVSMYQKLYAVAKKYDSPVVDCSLIVTDGDKQLYWEQKKAETVFERHKMLLNFGRLVTKIYKAEIFKKSSIRFPENIFYEDNYILPFLCQEVEKIIRIPDGLYFYFKNPQSTTRAKDLRFFERIESADKMLQDCQKYKEQKVFYSTLLKKYFYCHSFGTVHNAYGKFFLIPKKYRIKIKKIYKSFGGARYVIEEFGFNIKSFCFIASMQSTFIFLSISCLSWIKHKITKV